MSLADDLRRRFAVSAGAAPVYDRDDFDAGEPATPAAVLAAIVDRPVPTLLLTRRNAGLRRHPGQIAFPGGRADPGDAGPVDTALREAEEEVALPRSAVEIVGIDRSYRTGTGYEIAPVLGVVPPGLPLRPGDGEVAEIFEVPLAHVLDAANHLPREAEFRGRLRRYVEIPYEGYRIWGATAAMIVNLARRLGDG